MVDKHTLRTMVRGLYDVQEIRIESGNRLCANFRAEEGIDPNEKPEKKPEALKEIERRFRLITDGVIETDISRRMKFEYDGVISDYTKLSLIANYLVLAQQEKRLSNELKHAVKSFPIWTEFMKDVKGCGPTMAAVIISEIDISKATYPSSLWKFCFPAGSLVSTPLGMINIERISVGGKVYDADGSITAVKETMNRRFSGQLTTVSITGSPDITMTSEHPVLCVPQNKMDTVWREACDLKRGDRLVSPALKERAVAKLGFPDASNKAIGKLPLLGKVQDVDGELAYLMGRFLGDGSTTIYQEGKYERGRSCVTFGYHEKDVANELLPVYKRRIGHARMSDAGSALQLYFGRTTVTREFRKRFGPMAHTKRVPECILHSNSESVIKSFLRGYFDADGHVVPKGKSKGAIIASSASASLAYGVQFLLSRIGIWGSLHITLRKGTQGIIHGRVFNQRRERYVVNVPSSKSALIYDKLEYEGNRQARKIERRGGHFLLTVTGVKTDSVDDIEVFNLHTASNTYLVQNLAVHNCGVDVAPDGRGRSRRKEHLVDVEYVDANGKKTTRKSLTFKPFLKTKLIGVLAPSFVKQKDGLYRKIYLDYKHRIENMPAHEEKSKGHRNNMALRFVVKMFLLALYKKWRELEGLPVSDSYAEGKLKIVHRGP